LSQPHAFVCSKEVNSGLLKIGCMARKAIAAIFRSRFPHLYSTLDAPTEVPVQIAAYQLAAYKYIQPGDSVLDVGFGLGYGLKMMAEKAGKLVGIEIDRRAVSHAKGLVQEVPMIQEVRHYDGLHIPYDAGHFDVVTCVDVIEHVPNYMALIMEMVRVSRRTVLMSTPNRRPEYTRPDGRPKNYWHLREWSYRELDFILQEIPGVSIYWNFLNGSWSGPFEVSSIVSKNTLALTPVLMLVSPKQGQDNTRCQD